MSDGKSSFDDWLLDDEFDQLSADERSRLGQAVNHDPELANERRRLRRVLEPLDSWATPAPPERMVDNILDRIAAHEAEAPVVAASSLPTGADGEFSSRLPISFKELLALAAIITFFFAMFVPGIVNVRSKSRRVACAANLGNIGRGLSAYAAVSGNALPYVRMIPGGSWLPASDAGVPYSPNSRSRFLLLRFRYVGAAQSFICPSCRDAVALDVKNPQALNDFPDPRNCSYHSLNMAGPTPDYSKLCELPYMADANPLFVGGRFNRVDPTTANSHNHRGASGQNVLCFNGTVAWFETPNCGRDQDNIWQAGALRVYKGTEVQTRADDTFLTP